MINEEFLKRIIVEQQDFLEITPDQELWNRQQQGRIFSLLENDHVIFLTGIRRSGKSYLLKILKKMAVQEKEALPENFLYINFEDERLSTIEPRELSSLIELYYRVLNPDTSKQIFLFFDEIQNVNQWDRWVNRLFEQKKYKIFITGSNASLLKEETGRLLTGRSISIEVMPLSFFEYLNFYKKMGPYSDADFYKLERRTVIIEAFWEYLKIGGFPEYIKHNDFIILQEYFKDIIQRDIIYRYSIRYKKELKELAKIIISGPGNIQSLKKIAQAVGMANQNTVKNYLGYLQESFLIFSLPLFSTSVKTQIYNPDKYYGIDPGLFYAVSFSLTDNWGPVLENIIFLELKRRLGVGGDLFYYRTRTGKEVDFLIKDKGTVQLIQVSHDLSDKSTYQRELRAIVEAAKEVGVPKGLIINGNLNDTVVEEGIEITIFPAWQYLLTPDLVV